jgi:hypothetical protein
MAAVEDMTRMLARQLRRRLAPGLENPGSTAAIANVVALLVSGDGGILNGQVIQVDGETE